MKVSKFFPDSTAFVQHQSGSILSNPTKGVEITLHFREDSGLPHCAELSSGDHYAEIGLWFEGQTLTDYDGVFELPGEVIEMLEERGLTVDPDFKGED